MLARLYLCGSCLHTRADEGKEVCKTAPSSGAARNAVADECGQGLSLGGMRFAVGESGGRGMHDFPHVERFCALKCCGSRRCARAKYTWAWIDDRHGISRRVLGATLSSSLRVFSHPMAHVGIGAEAEPQGRNVQGIPVLWVRHSADCGCAAVSPSGMIRARERCATECCQSESIRGSRSEGDDAREERARDVANMRENKEVAQRQPYTHVGVAVGACGGWGRGVAARSTRAVSFARSRAPSTVHRPGTDSRRSSTSEIQSKCADRSHHAHTRSLDKGVRPSTAVLL